MSFFSRSPGSRSNPVAPSSALAQPRNTFSRLKVSLPRLFRRSHDSIPQDVDTTAVGDQQTAPDGHEQHNSIGTANDVPQTLRSHHHDLFNSSSVNAVDRNTPPDPVELATIPTVTQLESAQGFNISGNPIMTTIGMNTGVHSVTTVNNYGGSHGLEKLERFVSFAALHDSAEQDHTRRCHPGTRKNVLNQLRNWFDNPSATDRICWLHGPAGAGKSAIAQTIAHEYKKREVAATFFFYRSDPERSDGNRLFPTLAWQFAFSIPSIKDAVVHALDNTPHVPRQDVETQFEELVVYPFEQANKYASQIPQLAPVVIIDGIDECSDEQLQQRILSVIGDAVKDSLIPLRFFICSRPEASIEEVLNQFKDITVQIDLASLDDSNRDVEKYLMDQFTNLRTKCGLAPMWPSQEIIEEFVFKSSGNFIFAATVMRYISDEDCDPEEQLDIVRNLKPHGNMSPFALLDELYLEILKRQRDQEFLKTFLALLVGRSSVAALDLHEDDAMLMNISKKKLHIKLRRMRSLLQFEPFINVYHKSFLDFLQDSSRSGQYHVNGQKRYLELIVDRVVQHVSAGIRQPKDHENCSRPKFRSIVELYPPKFVLPIGDLQETLKPIQDLHQRLLETSKPHPCRFLQVMREFMLHLVILQGNSHHIEAAQAQGPNMNGFITEQSCTLVIEAAQHLLENPLDKCMSALFSYLPQKNSVLMADTLIIECMSSLLAFNHAEITARLRSVRDAQKLIDLIDLLINNKSFLNNCSRDTVRKAALLASEIFARVPLLPQSIFLNGPTQQCVWLFETTSGTLQGLCQSAFISRLLDHDYVLPSWCIQQEDMVTFVDGNTMEQNESIAKWLKRLSPDFMTRIRVMLGLAKTVQYMHSMGDVASLKSVSIDAGDFVLDSNLRVKVMSNCLFASQVREGLIYDLETPGYLAKFTYESNIFAFAEAFHSVCFRDENADLPSGLAENAKQLIKRCLAEDPKSRPTMDSVVKEIETWDLT